MPNAAGTTKLICVSLMNSVSAGNAIERHDDVLTGKLRSSQSRDGAGSNRARSERRRIHGGLYRREAESEAAWRL